MADLSKIKVGDKLRIEYTVTKCNGFGLEATLDSPSQVLNVTISSVSIIEAAEHIPAPRIFNWGDKVLAPNGERGLVLGAVPREPDTYWTTWFHNRSSPCPVKSHADELEPDEAPE